MGISPKLFQTATDGLVMLLVGASSAVALVFTARLLVRYGAVLIPSLSSIPFPRVLPLTGLALAVPGAGIASGLRVGSPQADLSWTETSEFPPPRSLVRSIGDLDTHPSVHPAIHSGHVYPGRLFPRLLDSATRPSDRNTTPEKVEVAAEEADPSEDVFGTRSLATRERAMRLHPAGKGITGRRYEVVLGDTLWDIAGKVLGTGDISRIARYWPILHRANVDTLGKDPSRIFPGQILRIPEERAV